MKIVPLAQVKDQFSAYVKESQTSPIVVTKNGKPVALLTGIQGRDDLDTLLLARALLLGSGILVALYGMAPA